MAMLRHLEDNVIILMFINGYKSDFKILQLIRVFTSIAWKKIIVHKHDCCDNSHLIKDLKIISDFHEDNR